MKTISVKVAGAEDDASSTMVMHERRVGTAWHRVGGRDVVTNKDKDAIDFQLRPGDRLVVEAYPNAAPERAVFDRDQATARPADANDRTTGALAGAGVQNPSATRQPGADTTKPVGQANPRPTSVAPDRGPENQQGAQAATPGVTGPAAKK